MKIKERIIKCIKEIIFEEIDEDQDLNWHDIDSLDYIEIIMEVEKEFHICIFESDIDYSVNNLNMSEFIKKLELIIKTKI